MRRHGLKNPVVREESEKTAKTDIIGKPVYVLER